MWSHGRYSKSNYALCGLDTSRWDDDRKKGRAGHGGSSGFGRVIAQRLHQCEYRVFGTSRSKDAVADPGVEMLTLDVRWQDSVQVCVRTVLDSEGRIDVLVNNAGITHLSLAEETDVDEARAVFETNLRNRADDERCAARHESTEEWAHH